MKIYLIFIFSILILSGSVSSQTIDKNATKETVALFKNMKKLSKKHTMFAHQHATEYGHGWRGDEDRSDVKSVCGSHPAMIGVDISGFSGRSEEAIKGQKKILKKMLLTRTTEEELQLFRGTCLIPFLKVDFIGKTMFHFRL